MTAASWPALGTTAALLVSAPEALPAARREVESELADIDAACSRFRADSELTRLNAAGGRPVAVGPRLLEALAAALAVAEQTGGRVTPTVGRALRAIGYDRDFAAGLQEPATMPAARVPAAAAIRVDGAAVTLAEGAELDLGATAKALAADRAAAAAHAATGAAVLVNLGGDIALAGMPPAGGWRVLIEDGGEVVALRGGGLATSSTTVRRWGGAHHIVDPATGRSCRVVWRTATVAARTCLAANAAATAAIVRGETAPAWLAARRLPSRLVHADGRVARVAGWPA